MTVSKMHIVMEEPNFIHKHVIEEENEIQLTSKSVLMQIHAQAAFCVEILQENVNFLIKGQSVKSASKIIAKLILKNVVNVQTHN